MNNVTYTILRTVTYVITQSLMDTILRDPVRHYRYQKQRQDWTEERGESNVYQSINGRTYAYREVPGEELAIFLAERRRIRETLAKKQ